MARADRPNVLVIMDDQHRYDFLGCAGAEFVRTPNIDRLAASGRVLTHCCTTSPVCGPARISLATGLLPTRTGTTTNNTAFMPLSVPNHYRHFRDYGYRVGLVGRHDLAKPGAPASVYGNRPLNYSYGFTRALEIEGGMSCARWGYRSGQVSGPYTSHLAEHGLFEAYCNDFQARCDKGWIIGASHDSVLPLEHHQDEFVATRAVERILGQEDDYPFYMFVNFQGPHDPFDPPVEFAERYREADVPEAIPATDTPLPERIHQRRHNYAHANELDVVIARRQYCAKIEFIDRQVGRILDAMDQRGFTENTIIVFASDHGEHVGDHGLFIKHTAYEPSMRVPLIMAGPGVTGGSSDALIELHDLNPTLVEMAGLPAQPHLDARSFASVLSGDHPAHREHCVTCEGEYRAIRTRRHKYIESPGCKELYDLETDPDEKDNTAAESPETTAELREALKARFTEGRWMH